MIKQCSSKCAAKLNHEHAGPNQTSSLETMKLLKFKFISPYLSSRPEVERHLGWRVTTLRRLPLSAQSFLLGLPFPEGIQAIPSVHISL